MAEHKLLQSLIEVRRRLLGISLACGLTWGAVIALVVLIACAWIDLVLDLPAGNYLAEWVSTKTGKVDSSEQFAHPGGEKQLDSPEYSQDIALRVMRRATRP